MTEFDSQTVLQIRGYIMKKNMIQIVRPNDEEIDFLLNGKEFYSVNHDEHGWAGMDAVQDVVVILAKKLGIKINI